jgi:hypothetical protein
LALVTNPGVVHAKTAVKDNLTTKNVYVISNKIISNYTEDTSTISSDALKEISNTNSSITNFGIQIKEVVVKPDALEKKDYTKVVKSLSVPDGTGRCNSANKTYMSYTAVTSRNSAQYKLLNSSKAYTDTKTGLRMYEGRICIAMGTGYASKIGTKINLVMANGSVVKCVLGDVKSNKHTDSTNRYQAQDGSVAEMIIDRRYFKSTSQYPSELDGKIKRVEIVE